VSGLDRPWRRIVSITAEVVDVVRATKLVADEVGEFPRLGHHSSVSR
jgi:hypothetical protein